MSGHPDQFFGGKTYSQHGEDLMIANLFWLIGKDKPSYLDIGAHHPWNISNTALLYKLGSRGVNVEANPNLIEEFHKARPEDKNLWMGVGHKNSKAAPFYMLDDKSGRNTFSKEEADKFAREYPEFYIREIKQIPMLTINQIVDLECKGKFPDLLSLDTEGFDYEILYWADFTVTKPKIICVEVRRSENSKFDRLLRQRGYFRHCRMGENVIYIQPRYEETVR